MNHKITKYSLIVLALIVLAVLIIFMNPVKVAATIAAADLYLILIIFIISTAWIFVITARWKVFFNNVSLKELVPIQMIGIAISNLTPGKIAEPIKTLLLKTEKNIRVSDSLQSVIFERISDIIVLVLISIIPLYVLISDNLFTVAMISIFVFVALVVTLLIIIYNKKSGIKIFLFFRKFPLLNRISVKFVENFYKKKTNTPTILKCFLISILAWVIAGTILYMSILALGFEISPILATGIVGLSTLIGIVSFLPGGIGTSEIVMVLLLGMAGIPLVLATAATIIFRLFTFWYISVLGFLYFLKNFSNKKIL